MNTGPAKFAGYELREHTLELLGRRLRFIGPRCPEALLDTPAAGSRFAADGYMPYWAEFWPASLLLVDAVAAWGPAPTQVLAPSILELGCGLGAVSIVLASLGYPVTASDYEPDALAFARENARINGIANLQTAPIDWRQTYPQLRVDRIVAAEVLYERRNTEPVTEFIGNHMDGKGFALICDRNRSTADDFPEVAQRAGLSVRISPAECSGAAGQPPVRGRVFHLSFGGL